MTTISKANGNTQAEVKAAFKLAVSEAIRKADAETKRTGKESSISTGITFTFTKGGR